MNESTTWKRRVILRVVQVWRRLDLFGAIQQGPQYQMLHYEGYCSPQ